MSPTINTGNSGAMSARGGRDLPTHGWIAGGGLVLGAPLSLCGVRLYGNVWYDEFDPSVPGTCANCRRKAKKLQHQPQSAPDNGGEERNE